MQLSHEALLSANPCWTASLAGVPRPLAEQWHAFMVRLRTLEETLIQEYHPADEIRCPVHFCVGQEAVPAVLSQLLAPADYLFSHHRSHGYFLAKGAPLNALTAELYGRQTGANGGVAGSQDISSPAHRMFAGAIISGSLAIGVGSAFAIAGAGRREVVVASCGEAAADEGAFWEAIQFAAARQLPIVFACENNRYSVFSDQRRRQPADNLSHRVRAFGMASEAVFGNDVTLVHRAFAAALERARTGAGPSFIEAYTYRWCSHVGPENDDHQGYRSPGELDFWKRNCPLRILREALREQGWLDETSERMLVAHAQQDIRAAIEFARESECPMAGDWHTLNLNPHSPLADRLLVDVETGAFNQNQAYSVPGPY